MTLAQLRALDLAAIWHGMTPDQQAEIGALALRMVAAQTIFEDTDPSITARDRNAASSIDSDCLEQLGPLVEASAPQVPWFTP